MTWFLVQGYAINHEGGSLPGFGGGAGSGPRPDQGLPGYGGGWDPGYGQGHPIGGHPGNRPPGSGGGPVDPGWGGGGWDHVGNRPPGSSGGHPGNALPGWPPTPDNSLPGGVHKGEIFIVAYHPEHGLRWVKVSDINSPGNELPGRPPHASGQPVPGGGQPDQGLPPVTAAPKK
jgi:hypothetical protein